MKITYNKQRLVDWNTVDRSALTDAKIQMMHENARAFLEEQRDVLAIQGKKAQHLLTISAIITSALLAYIGGGEVSGLVFYAFITLISGCILSATLCIPALQIKHMYNTHRLPEVYFKDDFYTQSEQNMTLASIERMNNLGIYHGKFIWRNARCIKWGYRVFSASIIAACLAASFAALAQATVGY